MAHRVSARRLDCQHLEVAKRNKEIGSRIKAPALLRPTVIVRGDMSVPAIQPNLWRNFYNGAFCETGDKTARLVKVNPSTSICLRRLTAFSREGSSECENILTALDDLKILKSLQTRDSPEVAEVQRRYFVAKMQRCRANQQILWLANYYFAHDSSGVGRTHRVGHNWGTSRGESLVANRRQNKDLWCSAV